ncbi:S8 family serine peptidase [Agaribacter flavus]|uniref:S8 family serine peptidase n=1 Tax=Agaribacter flavus TaxID=1902781 RepID=A0ABV7FNQ6_9ALTE
MTAKAQSRKSYIITTSEDINVNEIADDKVGLQLRRGGILAVAAAGNSGRTNRPYVGNPARCPSFLAVSAVDSNIRRANFSSFGPQVELAAPGVGIWSTTHDGHYGKKNGTSMACPHVAGVAALNKARRPAMTGDQIRRRLHRTARDVGISGRAPFYGYGLVNAYRSVR